MNYSKLIQESYRATFQHKRMWWLGMAILTGGGLGSRWFSNGLQLIINSDDTTALSDAITGLFNDSSLQDWWADSWWLVFVAVGLLFLLWIVAGLTHLVAQSGLYYGAQQARLGRPVKFKEMCAVGVKTFWRYLGFYILLALARALVGLAFLLSLITLLASVIGVIVAVPLLFIIVLFGWALVLAVEVFVIYCLQSITLQQYSSLDTFQAAWNILRQHGSDSMIVAVILRLIRLVLTLAGFLFYLILAAPFAILTYVAYTSEAWLMLILSLVAGSLLLITVWLFLKGMLQSFYAHLWHRLYASF